MEPSSPPPLLPEHQVATPSPLTAATSSASNDTIASEITIQLMQQKLALMQQMMLQQMALAQQPMYQPITNEASGRPRK